jgi:hypothetical protein
MAQWRDPPPRLWQQHASLPHEQRTLTSGSSSVMRKEGESPGAGPNFICGLNVVRFGTGGDAGLRASGNVDSSLALPGSQAAPAGLSINRSRRPRPPPKADGGNGQASRAGLTCQGFTSWVERIGVLKEEERGGGCSHW